jgi:succinate dehydrogenase / fumarate reductase membrane anchor subunit
MGKKAMKSYLAKVKGLGAAGNGTSTWWMQRITSVALVPLVVWYVVMVIKIANSENLAGIIDSPLNIVMLMLFTLVAIYHSSLGMIEVIEDYVHCKVLKLILLIILKFLSIFTAAFSFIAIIMFHVSIFTGSQ